MKYISEELTPDTVKSVISKHLLNDRMDMVMDLERSHGSYVYDSLHNKEILDFFSCYATLPLGYNHPKMLNDEDFKRDLLAAALINPTNSDVNSMQSARFINAFDRVGIPEYLPHAFFVAGGALAIENTLKVAMDWKVQKNYQKGYTREVGTKIMHFQEAFHGRSGYTMSLTNTDPTKIRYFAKFESWPRILNPKIHFPLTEQNLKFLLQREMLAINQIKQAFIDNRDEIAAIIIEPIQSEGGDNHFRTEFMIQLRQLCDENDCLLIYDEVQTGCGASGKFWAHEYFGSLARPDMIGFGKKMQICGVLAGAKVDEVATNCFRVSSRINSTWGGNLVDMVRSTRILQIIEEDNILAHVQETGKYLLDNLVTLSQKHSHVTNVRGLGQLIAFDLFTPHLRNEFIKKGFTKGAMFLGCGSNSIRFRPTLTITKADIDKGLAIIDEILSELNL